MQIKQFEDKSLAHYSYAILSESEKKIVLIDPSRNPQPYIDYAKENDAEISIVIETHPHADFVSSHLELQNAGATIYVSKLVGAFYSHQCFDEGQHIQIGKIKLSALNTPGHSLDSICILFEHDGIQKAVFTGDTLFIGDCGRPDLRPDDGDTLKTATKLAKQMYSSLRNKLMPLADDNIVYPTHGAGSLCGKGISKESSSTLGKEKKTNWSLREQTSEEFVKELLSGQPFIPAYFAYNVELNKKGVPAFNISINAVNIGESVTSPISAKRLNPDIWIIDARNEQEYKAGHLKQSINLMGGEKFETWLGSMIKPLEKFYLAGGNVNSLKEMIARTAAIGYEPQILEAFVLNHNEVNQEKIDVKKFKENQGEYTIIDVRNESEVEEQKIFKNSLAFPLGELRNNLDKIPTNKPIVVHCAGGYRSAAGSSFLQSALKNSVKIYDLGEAIKEFE